MTSDGSKVFFSSEEHLTGEDTAHSGADIYMWEEGKPLDPDLQGRIRNPGQPGDNASCDPASNTKHVHWNTTGTEENCGDVAIGGGGGVASGDGTIYFLSPETLDASNPKSQPVQNAPNLYVTRAGSGAPLRRYAWSRVPTRRCLHPPIRSFAPSALSKSQRESRSIDSNGDVYVLDITGKEGTGTVQKFDPSGHSVTGFGTMASLTVTRHGGRLRAALSSWLSTNPTATSTSPTSKTVPCRSSTPRATAFYRFRVNEPSGVAVDQTDGDVYVSSYSESAVDVFAPDGNFLDAVPDDRQPPTGLAINSAGTVYVVNGGGDSKAKGITEIYGPTGTDLGQLDTDPSDGVAVDPSDDHVYVDEGKRVSPSSTPPATRSVPRLARGSSRNRSASPQTRALSPSRISAWPTLSSMDRRFCRPTPVPTIRSFSTASARRGSRDTADFQITPSGDYAAFPSALPLTGLRQRLLTMRSSAMTPRPRSSNAHPAARPSEQATGEATLPANGSGLSVDGRVFFNSTEGLVDRDLNEKEDAYEWEPQGFEFGHGSQPCNTAAGCIQLISTGSSPFASSLLGISADGTDAYFFTRDKLVEQDENGGTVKIYDARSLGGFPYSPPVIQCKASDECHGRGLSDAAPTQHQKHRQQPRSLSRAEMQDGISPQAGQVRTEAEQTPPPRQTSRSPPSQRCQVSRIRTFALSTLAVLLTLGGTFSPSLAPKSQLRPLKPKLLPPRREVTPTSLPPSRWPAPEAPRRPQCDLQRPPGPLRQPLRDHPLHCVRFRARSVPLQLPGRVDHRLRQLRRRTLTTYLGRRRSLTSNRRATRPHSSLSLRRLSISRSRFLSRSVLRPTTGCASPSPTSPS